MGNIKFNDTAIENAVANLRELESKLNIISGEIGRVSGNLKLEISSRQRIISNLLSASRQTGMESRNLAMLRSALSEVSKLYRDTERRLAGIRESGSQGNHHSSSNPIIQFLEGILHAIEAFLISIGILPGGPDNSTSEYAGEPVDMCIGSYVNSIQELCLKGEPTLEFVRYYNSRFPQMGTMGFGWSHNLECRLSVGAEELVLQSGDVN